MFNHIMLDLETLDNAPTSVIMSVGAVRFDFVQQKLGQSFYSTVDPLSCQEVGMTIGARTVEWWMTQSGEARAAFTGDKPPIQKVLADFNAFVNKTKDSYMWGNGSTFDNVIIRHAFGRCGIKPNWSYRNDLCFRTMLKMFPVSRDRVGTFHNALDDAKSQAKTLLRIVGGLK